MGVGRAAQKRRATAAALILVGAPIWLLGSAASAQTSPKHGDWPALPPEQPPATQRLWPPPEPPRPPRPDTSTEETARPDETPPAKDAPPPPPVAPAPPPQVVMPQEPAADPNQLAGPPAPPAATAAPARPAPQPPPPGGVYVELRSEDPGMRIDQVAPGGHSWPACEIPCRRVLQRNLTYVVQSDQAPPTSAFMLPENVNSLTLDAHPGSQARGNVGTLLGVMGGIVGLIGFIRLTTTGNSPSSDRNGLELVAVGAAVGISGFVLYRMSRTTVITSTGSTFSEQRDRGASARSAPSIALTPQGLIF